MAHRMDVRGHPTLDFIYNVSHHVGDAPHCRNADTDVWLVKVLLYHWIKRVRPNIHPSCHEPFVLGSGMNLRTAYWIRVLSESHSSRLSFKEKGVISPARGSFFGNDTWTIVRLNHDLKKHNPQVFANLAGSRDLSAELQRELAA